MRSISAIHTADEHCSVTIPPFSDTGAASTAIAGARGAIRDRFLRVTQSTVPGADFFGYEGTPSLDRGLGADTGRSAQRFKAQDPNWQQTADASKDYMTWLNAPTTKPTQCSDPSA